MAARFFKVLGTFGHRLQSRGQGSYRISGGAMKNPEAILDLIGGQLKTIDSQNDTIAALQAAQTASLMKLVGVLASEPEMMDNKDPVTAAAAVIRRLKSENETLKGAK
jgi:hypothetical protein